MGVPEGKRKENRLEVWLAAVRLTKYTMEITSNKRSFPGRYSAMTERICGRAWDVQTSLWEANNIWVGQGCPRENVEERRHLQDMAVAGLRALLADIDAAGKILKRPTKKTTYWAGLAIEALSLATAWRDSDSRRLQRGQAATPVWSGSANRNASNANNEGCVNPSGNVTNTNASNGNVFAPD